MDEIKIYEYELAFDGFAEIVSMSVIGLEFRFS